MKSKEGDLRLALLIDAENISPKYTQVILSEASILGNVIYRRAYGDWSAQNLSSWRKHILDNGIQPIQQFSATTGKNSSDSALIIDAMDLLYAGNLDGFCIVSSDSDFTRLAARLRESQMFVLGMGETKTARSFISACNRFVYLDLLQNSRDKAKNSSNKKQSGTNQQSKQSQQQNQAQKQKQTAANQHEAQKQAANQAHNQQAQQQASGNTHAQQAQQQQNQKKSSPLAIIKASASKPGESSSGRFRLSSKHEKALEGEEARMASVQAVEATASRHQTPVVSEELIETENGLEESLEGLGSDLDAVRDLVRNLVDERSGDDGWIFSGVIGNLLIKHMPDFDVRNFGYRKLTPFLTSLELFEVKSIPNKDDNSIRAVYIKLKEQEEQTSDTE